MLCSDSVHVLDPLLHLPTCIFGLVLSSLTGLFSEANISFMSCSDDVAT